jgi:hypothetical protein
MRKILFLLVFCMGCTATNIPAYLKDTKPYTKRFYAAYDQTLESTKQALEDMGWKIERTVDPLVYEQSRATDLDERQVLIFTQVRQMPMFVATRYAKMNIFVRGKGGISEVEIRYLTVTSTPVKTMETYQNAPEAERIFERISELVNGTKM